MKINRAKDWLKQAKNDFLFAQAAEKNGFFAQTCFICQQAAEKALKAILYSKGAAAVTTHSLRRLCEELGINHKLLLAAKMLDQYYISSRYPDALAEGAPCDAFTKEQAKEALRFAGQFLRKAKNLVR